MNARAIAAALVLIALAFFAARDFARLGDALPWRTMDDFPDFYCAGWVLDRGASPYTYEPLRTCEHRVNAGLTFRGRLFAGNPAIAVPAPQPPYDFGPFMALAETRYKEARAIYIVALAVTLAGCAAGLAALGVPVVLAIATLILSVGYASLNTGQIVPFALLALVLCGWALARKRDRVAGVLAALTAIEPTLGLPVALAAFFFVPRARATLVITLLALLLASLATVGYSGVLAYLFAVLPAHAASELRFPFQYSLTYALAFLGAPAVISQAAGALSYVAGIGLALWLAPRTSRWGCRRELLVFLPALACVAGGAFVHQEELCFAIPALTIYALETTGATKVIATTALCILSIPWIAVWGAKQLFLAAVLVCAAILVCLRLPWRPAAIVLIGIAAALYGFELFPPHLPTPGPAALHAYPPGDLVQHEWRDYTEQRSTHDFAWFAIKIPAWAALLGGFVSAMQTKAR